MFKVPGDIFKRISKHDQMYIYINLYTLAYAYTHAHIHTHACMHTRTHTRTHTHTYAHAHTELTNVFTFTHVGDTAKHTLNASYPSPCLGRNLWGVFWWLRRPQACLVYRAHGCSPHGGSLLSPATHRLTYHPLLTPCTQNIVVVIMVDLSFLQLHTD